MRDRPLPEREQEKRKIQDFKPEPPLFKSDENKWIGTFSGKTDGRSQEQKNKLLTFDETLRDIDLLKKREEQARRDLEKDIFFYQLPLNLDVLSKYLKPAEDKSADPLAREEGEARPGETLLSEIELTLKRTCPNPSCDHQTLEENPTEIAVPQFDCINSIEQIIEIAKTYHCQKNVTYKGIDMKRLYGLIEPLEELQTMIGLKKNKTKIVEQILYFVKGLQDENKKDMMHTVITGPPGTGKTTFARIIGKVYSKLGLVSSGHFVEVTREDLVGKYLGHTAPQTNKTIEKCQGGIMFIDEVYSLGHSEKRDSFSKECIDVLNQKLSENRDMLCIIAGYQEDIEKCFFNQNKGLKRRFPFIYDIEGYNNEEMLQIFKQKIRGDNWEIDDKLLKEFTNRFDAKVFKYFGGDIESFVFKTKIAFAQIHFYQEDRRIDRSTLEKAFALFEESRKDPKNEILLSMFI
jgi:SpoVK/Ycf46/Vps4 family AAA+-type ATPase